MDNISKNIRELVKKQGTSLLWLGNQIGFSPQGFLKMLNNNSYKIEVLYDIAKSLNVPITALLGDSSLTGEALELKKEIDALKKEVGYLKVIAGNYRKLLEIYEEGRNPLESGDFNAVMQQAIRGLNSSYFRGFKKADIEKIKDSIRAYPLEFQNDLESMWASDPYFKDFNDDNYRLPEVTEHMGRCLKNFLIKKKLWKF